MEAEIRFGNGVSILEQDKKNNSTGEWEFHIDIDSIRAQSQEDSADSLIAQLDQMAQQDGTPASEMEEGSLDEPAGKTRVLPAAEQKQTSAADDVTSEQTIVIPTASQAAHRSSPSATGRQVTSTRAASSAGKAPTGRGNSGTRQQPGKTSGNKSAAGSAPASKAALTPAQQRRMQRAQRKREKRLARVERSRQRPKFRLAPVLASLLAITNVVTLGGYGFELYSDPADSAGG